MKPFIFTESKALREYREEQLAAELREMASLGWDKDEAYTKTAEFLQRVGEVGGGFTEKEIFQTWENVWEQIEEETEG